MDQFTNAGAAPQAGARPQETSQTDTGEALSDADAADQLGNLWDSGAFAPTDENGNDLMQEQQERLERQAQGQEEPTGEETDPEGRQPQARQPQQTQQQTQQQEQGYRSLEEFLTGEKISRDDFLELPVTLTVDGKPQQIPLKELVKERQLASASYARMQEAAQVREAFKSEQAQVRQALGQRIEQAEALFMAANEALLGDANRIPWEQLRQQDPANYAALQQDFRTRSEQLQGFLAQIANARQQQALEAEQARQQAIPQELQKLYAARPEWNTEQARKAAHGRMRDFAHQMGFSDAELNGILDHRYMLVLDMAAQFAQLQASNPGVKKRVIAAPRMVSAGARVQRNPQASAYARDRQRAFANPRDEDAQAALFGHFLA